MKRKSLYSVLMLVAVGLAGQAMGDTVSGSLYNAGDEVNAKSVVLPVTTQVIRQIRLFDRQIAYRNDRKACIVFELPLASGEHLRDITMRLEAYNDDNQYLRAVWFEIDGIGGYIGVSKVAEGQYRGDGTIGTKQTKVWELPLERFPISLKGKATSEVNFAEMLKEPGKHTVCSWISTYSKFGPNSWITLDLEIQMKNKARSF